MLTASETAPMFDAPSPGGRSKQKRDMMQNPTRIKLYSLKAICQTDSV